MNPFKRYRSLKPWPFCWRVTVEGVGISLLAALLISIVIPEEERDFDGMEGAALLFVVIVLAPLIETFLFQALPVFIAKLFRARVRTQMLASIIPFFIAHLFEGLAVGISAGLVGGFYFAFTYIHWRSKSLWTALWVTAVSHFLRNLFGITIFVFSDG